MIDDIIFSMEVIKDFKKVVFVVIDIYKKVSVKWSIENFYYEF